LLGQITGIQPASKAAALDWQLARALGATPVVTSSSDEKPARARQLGAAVLVNYRSTPDWEKAVLEATGGVQQALEVGGKQTLPKTLASPGALFGEVVIRL
jgi:NADPH:quinone reductase-like Zn-dependent oxidoreductase